MKLNKPDRTAETSVLILLIICFVITVPAFCGYQIALSTIDGGGGQSTGKQYVLNGTIGQPDAGYAQGGSYELLGGFWPGGPLCIVDFPDFSIFADYWLQTDTGLPADLDKDGDVDLDDLKLFVAEWLCACPYNWPLK
jgi:hypothetical protein